MSFSPGERVVLKPGLPQAKDHVGTVVSVDPDGVVWVQWAGHEAPDAPTKYSPRALVAWADD